MNIMGYLIVLDIPLSVNGRVSHEENETQEKGASIQYF